MLNALLSQLVLHIFTSALSRSVHPFPGPLLLALSLILFHLLKSHLRIRLGRTEWSKKRQKGKKQNGQKIKKCECKIYRIYYIKKITVLYIILKVLPSLTSSKVTVIHHNLMADKDHKEAALKA